MIKFQIIDLEDPKEISYTEQELYWLYKNELWEISGEQGVQKAVVDSWYLDIIQNSEIYLIRILDTLATPEQIGFMSIGVNSSCHSEADYYVWDSYILPEYRHQHIMETLFQMFVKGYNHEGKYCMFILDDNIPAVCFWEKQFWLLGYKECGIDDYSEQETSYCHLHAYEG